MHFSIWVFWVFLCGDLGFEGDPQEIAGINTGTQCPTIEGCALDSFFMKTEET